MPKVLIVVDDPIDGPEQFVGVKATTVQQVNAMQDAILRHSPNSVTTQVITSTDLAQAVSSGDHDHQWLAKDIIWCPLTLTIPNSLSFPAQDIFQACNQVARLRQRVEQLGYATGGELQGLDCFYLPVVLTAKGGIYGEVIGKEDNKPGYVQPVDLLDQQRQPLYHLAYKLLQSLAAPPSVYLLQFRYNQQALVFDRLWPFPAAPAIASVNVQEPDLFTCHWYCLSTQPIIDLTITPKTAIKADNHE